MSNAIKLSPKYGVNPTIPVCFWCGEHKNEIVFLGRIGGKEDIKAPNDICINYEPCDECRELMNRGLAVLEAHRYPASIDTPAYHGAYPTGRWLVMTSKAAVKIFGPEIPDKIFAEPALFEQINGCM